MLTKAGTDVAKKRKPSERYENLTPMEEALLDLQRASNDRVVAAIEKLEAKAPSYRLVAATASSIILGVLVLVVYLVSLVAEGRGIETAPAADATKAVIGAVVEPKPEPAEPPAPSEEVVDG